MPAAPVVIKATFTDILYTVTVIPEGAIGSECVTANVTKAKEGTLVTLSVSIGANRRVALNSPRIVFNPTGYLVNGASASFRLYSSNLNEITATFFYAPLHPAGYAETSTIDSTTYNMRYVPAGKTFVMGAHISSDPKVRTPFKNIWMGESEVTQELWEAVCGSWPGSAPNALYGQGEDYPCYNINYYDAVVFCNLATEKDSSLGVSEQVYYSDAGLTSVYTLSDAASGALYKWLHLESWQSCFR